MDYDNDLGGMDTDEGASTIPKWKIPLSRSYSSSFYSDRRNLIPEEDSNVCLTSFTTRSRQNSIDNGSEAVIQILLPCIICNRTFSPEALERHSRICTKVNIIDPKQPKSTYDSHAFRIKNTKVADFIPPSSPTQFPESEIFSRNSNCRRSLQSNRGSIREKSLTLDHPPRQIRAVSTPKTINFRQDSDNYGSNSSEFGSSEDSGGVCDRSNNTTTVPSYARALSPAEDCPYCLRSFGIKAYERHVGFCRELWERRQYEHQPIPKEIEHARERQDLRTKFRPLKGSNSLSSLRSMSPGKDTVSNFASLALSKLFGAKTPNFKKSNDSLTTSCYGDFARTTSIRHPSPSRPFQSKIPTTTNPMTSSAPMRINTKSNLPGVINHTKSHEGLDNNVSSSGYGQGGHYMSGFSRNTKSRSSLGRNFFRSGKRIEPEGLENTNTNGSTPNSPLIITPINFYNKGGGQGMPQVKVNPEFSNKSTLLFSSDPKYDPYEKAAKQLEELLKSQPQQHPQRLNTQRKIGIDRALASVMGQPNVSSSLNKPQLHPPPKQSYNQLYSFLRDEDPFTNISADESYWEEILKAKRQEQKLLEPEVQSPVIQNGKPEITRIHTTEEKRDSSDSSSGCGTDNYKFRDGGISNVSSADSGFSRSDGRGITDLEFETLESLLGVVGVGKVGKEPIQPPPPIYQRLPIIRDPRRQYTSPNQTSQYPSLDTNDTIVTSSELTSIKKILQPQSSLTPTFAKFCHECGTPYPTPVAKFCPECGERRVLNI